MPSKRFRVEQPVRAYLFWEGLGQRLERHWIIASVVPRQEVISGAATDWM